MTERRIVEAREPFALTLNGTPLSVSRGDRYWSDDPLVKGREQLFTELTVKSSQPRPRQPVETATAEPGERRTITRGKQAKAGGQGAGVDEEKPDA